jgi:glycosyltransferase involved in cell wall biosynthesis
MGGDPDPAMLLSRWGLDPVALLAIRRLPLLRAHGARLRFSWNAVFHGACLMALRRRPYDVVYVRHPRLAAFLLRSRALHRLPVVYEAHEVFHLTTARPERAAALRALEARIFRGVDGIVAITASLRQAIEDAFRPAAPIAVVPDGVRLERFAPGRWTGGRLICYVGQLYPWKGVDVLVRAMRYLGGEQAVIVGGTDRDVERIRALAAREGAGERVRVTGQVEPRAAAEYLGHAGIAVLPGSRTLLGARFTSPLKLFEYMAAGVPVVAADLPSFREILSDGESALLVPPEDPEALAGGIRRLLDDPSLARKIRANALERVRHYSWQERARRIIPVLEAVRHRGAGAIRAEPARLRKT